MRHLVTFLPASLLASLLLGCAENSILTKIGNLAVRKDPEEEAIRQMQEAAAAKFRDDCWNSDQTKLTVQQGEGGTLVFGKPGCGMMTGMNLQQLILALPPVQAKATQMAIEATIQQMRATYGNALNGAQITITVPNQ